MGWSSAMMMRISLSTSQPPGLACIAGSRGPRKAEVRATLRHIGSGLGLQGNRDRDRGPVTGNGADVTATTKQPSAFRHARQTETSPSPAVNRVRARCEPPAVLPDHNLNDARIFLDRHCSFRGFRVFRHIIDALLNDAEDVDLRF